MHGRQIESAAQDLHELFAVVGYATAGTAQGKGWPYDHREADLGGKFRAVANIVHQRGAWNIKPNARHGIFEEQAIFRFLDGLESAPIISTSYFSRMPASARSTARFRAVCPPTVGSRANLPVRWPLLSVIRSHSRRMISSAYSGVKGSIYVRSANSGSVMMVAGSKSTSTTS